jgi:Tat protein secretion system quality control protein TatD with DNase activity
MGKKILDEINELVLGETKKPKAKSSKAKGRNLQNWVAEKIRQLTGLPKTDVKPAIMGETGMDIKLSQEARRKFPFAVECKNQEKMNIWASLEQAELSAKAEGLMPLLIFKRNNTDRYVTLKAEDFFKLLEMLKEGDK